MGEEGKEEKTVIEEKEEKEEKTSEEPKAETEKKGKKGKTPAKGKKKTESEPKDSEDGKPNEESAEKTPKRRKSAESKESVDPTRTSERAKKKPEVFQFKEAEEKKFEVPEGKGTPLGEIPNIEKRLLAKQFVPIFRKLHTICFPGHKSNKGVVGKHLKQFKGFPSADADKTLATIEEKLGKSDIKTLKLLADLLDVEGGHKKEELVKHIAAFVLKPTDSGKPFKALGSSKSSGKSKKTGKRKERSGSSRPLNAYMLFVKDNREEVAKDNKGKSVGEISTILGQMWKKLSEKEQQKYKDKAAKLKEEAGDGEKAKPAKKSQKSKKKEKDEETDSDDEAPLKKKEKKSVSRDELKGKISAILKEGDLESLSVKKIRAQLEKEYGEEAIAEEKDFIKEFINAELAKL